MINALLQKQMEFIVEIDAGGEIRVCAGSFSTAQTDEAGGTAAQDARIRTQALI